VPLDISTITNDEVIRIAIRLEEDGIQFYKAASEKAHSKHLRDVLNLLAGHEAEHKSTFQALAREVGADLSARHHSRSISPENLQALTEAGVFPRPEEWDSAIASLHSAAQALRFGIKVEQGSIAFYESAARAAMSDDVRETFNRILAQERQHVRLLTAELKAHKATSLP